jgi:NAD(P)-dependent dehydrogenase (short-subunit alcohol dehydrogenase family)
MTTIETHQPPASAAPGVVLVTGGSRGIGAAVVRAAAAAGHAVGFTWRARDDAARELVDELGPRTFAVRADVGVEADVVHAFDAVTAALGPITGVVNNAGITGGAARFADVSEATIAAVLRTNVLGAMLVAREAVRRMSTARGGAGGALVNISSGAARSGSPHVWVHYAATKGAIDTLTLGLAREVAREGMRVNAVRPGLTDTDMLDGGRGDAMARMVAGIPLGRTGTPEEIAAAVVWLLGPAASFVTGALLDVTGGT